MGHVKLNQYTYIENMGIEDLEGLSAEYKIHVMRLTLPKEKQKDFITTAMLGGQRGGANTKRLKTIIDRVVTLYMAVDNEQDYLKLFRYHIFFGKGVENFLNDLEAKKGSEYQAFVKTIPDCCWNAVSI